MTTHIEMAMIANRISELAPMLRIDLHLAIAEYSGQADYGHLASDQSPEMFDRLARLAVLDHALVSLNDAFPESKRIE